MLPITGIGIANVLDADPPEIESVQPRNIIGSICAGGNVSPSGATFLFIY